MIGQVAALRDRVCDASPSCTSDVAVGGAARLDGARAAGAPADGRGAAARATSPSSAWPASCPRRRTSRRSGRTSSNKVDAITEVPRGPLGLAACTSTPTRKARDKIYSQVGRLPRRRAVRPAALRHPADLAAVDRAAPAPGARGGAPGASPTPATPTAPFAASAPSVILGAGGGIGDLGLRYAFRVEPAAAARRRCAAERAGERAARVDRGLVRRHPAERRRRPHRQPLRPRRRRTTRSTPPAPRRWPRVYAGVRGARVAAPATWCSSAAPTPCRTRSATCASARRRRCRPRGRCRHLRRRAPTASRSARASPCVVLKRLADAERDGDRIYAVIKGVARLERRPRPRPDRAAARRARCARSSAPTPHAGVSPATVGLVEAHGTGTVAGDRGRGERALRGVRRRPARHRAVRARSARSSR